MNANSLKRRVISSLCTGIAIGAGLYGCAAGQDLGSRGTTSGPLVKLLRDAGALEVHLRVACPPIRHPCFMGVDMATRAQLIAHNRSLEEIRLHIGADSLAYISEEGLRAAISNTDTPLEDTGHCYACMTGHYPLKIPEWLFEETRDKNVFEGA